MRSRSTTAHLYALATCTGEHFRVCLKPYRLQGFLADAHEGVTMGQRDMAPPTAIFYAPSHPVLCEVPAYL